MKKIIVNHPSFTVMVPHDVIARWSRWGAWIEMTACEFGAVVFGDDRKFNPIQLFNQYQDAGVDPRQMFISSDFGQSISPEPVEGMYKFLCLIHDQLGYGEDVLNRMTKTIPAYLMSERETAE